MAGERKHKYGEATEESGRDTDHLDVFRWWRRKVGREVVINNDGAEVDDGNEGDDAGIFERVQLSQEAQGQHRRCHEYRDPKPSVHQDVVCLSSM